MKSRILLLLFLFLCFTSCEPTSYVRLIKDKVKETDTYILKFGKHSYSAIKKNHKYFDLELVKSNRKPGFVDIFITTNIFPTDSQLVKELYFLVENYNLKYDLETISEIPINKDIVTNEYYTTYQTTTSHVPTVTTETKTVNNVPVSTTKTTMNLVTNEIPIRNTRQVHSKVNYIVNKTKLTIDESTLLRLVSSQILYLRVYNSQNDFWSINFNKLETQDLLNFLNNRVLVQNITTN